MIQKTLPLLLALTSVYITHAQRVTVDFDEYDDGTILTNQVELQELGVTFPGGLEVRDCSMSDICSSGSNGAYSGTKIGWGLYDTEFSREPVNIQFDTLQDEVVFYAKGAVESSLNILVNGYQDGTWVDYQEIPVNDDNFQQITVNAVDEVNITTDGPTPGYVIIDNLTFDNYENEVEEDTEAPFITIYDPSNWAEITTDEMRVYVATSDDSQLDSVNLTLLRDGEEYDFLNLCGRAGVPCPAEFPSSYEAETFFHFTDADNGDFQLQARACDIYGNCASTTINFTVNITPPVDITPRVLKLELNQGVQNRLFDVDGPGHPSSANSYVPLIEEKNTLVRYYIAGDGGTKSNYSGELQLITWDADGSENGRYSINPKVNGTSTVDVPEDPGSATGRRDMIADMRASLDNTLNFVIPGHMLEGADETQLTLFDGNGAVHGGSQINLYSPTRMGINFIKMDTSVNRDDLTDKIVPYLQSTLPVSAVQVLTNYLVFYGPKVKKGDDDNSCNLKSKLNSAYGGGDTPAIIETDDPSWTTTLGVLNGIRGCAPIGNPQKDNKRHRKGAVIRVSGPNALHEIGHLMGLEHSGGAHGEKNSENDFTYPHGLRATTGYSADFGVTIDPSTSDPGQWDVTLDDPCPVGDPADRYPCQANDGPPIFDFISVPPPYMGHDIMSYGWRRWVSNENYRRMYEAIALRSHPYKSVASDQEEETRQEALVISGRMDSTAGLLIDDVMQKSVLPEYCGETSEGEYQLSILDADDNVMFTKHFEMEQYGESECCSGYFNVVTPLFKDYEKIIIRQHNLILKELEGSNNKPAVELIKPIGGESYENAIQIEWMANDMDDDSLEYFIQYSPDLGKTWTPLALYSDTVMSEATLETERYVSDSAVIRINVSDGFYTATDYSRSSFCINNEDNNCSKSAPVEMPSLDLFNANNPTATNITVFPVPFKEEATFRFQLSQEADVNIELHDMAGRVVDRLETGRLHPGCHHYPIYGESLEQGLYFVTLVVGENIYTRKIIKGER